MLKSPSTLTLQPAKPSKQPRLKRIMIIDGFNVMRSSHNLVTGLQCSPYDSRMNAITLLPMLKRIIKQGFRVRVVFKRLPKPFEILHNYIIGALNQMRLILYPEKDFLEADDKMMLEIAQRYGSMIITNDAFRNHEEYKEIATNNTIKYKKERNSKFSLDALQKGLIFENKIHMLATEDKVYCYPNSRDYRKVKSSHNNFWPATKNDIKAIDSLCDYVYYSICFQMGLRIPRSIKFMDDRENMPHKYVDFCVRNKIQF
uniref:RNase NYN domain-containing protein n=1 Tax=Panagrolaimus sp. PS1159 TaxID=55785 RepID=A0AC35FQD2_9BILA